MTMGVKRIDGVLLRAVCHHSPSGINIVMIYGGYGLDTGFMDHLYTSLETTLTGHRPNRD
jgi:hypothetical protein